MYFINKGTKQEPSQYVWDRVSDPVMRCAAPLREMAVFRLRPRGPHDRVEDPVPHSQKSSHTVKNHRYEIMMIVHD